MKCLFVHSEGLLIRTTMRATPREFATLISEPEGSHPSLYHRPKQKKHQSFR